MVRVDLFQVKGVKQNAKNTIQAGLRMEDIVGSNTSCYVGSFTRDYPEMVASDRENLPLYHGIGAGDAILSNRISWFFDLRGPSISIDTACSSSLVALHLGCQSLRTGESEMVTTISKYTLRIPC